MSANTNKESGCDLAARRCANCGVEEKDGDDGVKLKQCSACHLVRYCSVKCQKEHRPKHKRECKRRMAEMRNEILFKQPESTHLGDCPICCLPLMSLQNGPDIGAKPCSSLCCSKFMCQGCYVTIMKKSPDNRFHTCPFCREQVPDSAAVAGLQEKGRLAVDYPAALRRRGTIYKKRGDYQAAYEYFSRAAELGDVDAHYELGYLYFHGEGGIESDMTKAVFHFEKAAIAGHPDARCYLGAIELRNFELERAIKHFMIAGKQGDIHALNNLKGLYKKDVLRKDELAKALRGYQAAVYDMKSPQRDAAVSLYREGGVNVKMSFDLLE